MSVDNASCIARWGFSLNPMKTWAGDITMSPFTSTPVPQGLCHNQYGDACDSHGSSEPLKTHLPSEKA